MTKFRFLSICGCTITFILLLQFVESNDSNSSVPGFSGFKDLFYPSDVNLFYSPINFGQQPMWTHPCKSGTVNKDPVGEFGKANRSEEALIYDSLFNLTETAFYYIDDMKDRWADSEFKDFYLYKNKVLWYVFIPTGYLPKPSETKKVFGASSPEFEYGQRNEMLNKFYLWFQKVALGMEQAVHDRFHNNDSYRDEFAHAYKDIQLVLCELELAMFKFGVVREKKDDVDRGLMSIEERTIDSRLNRQIRDFTIIREYYTMMQFLYDVMKKFIALVPILPTTTPIPKSWEFYGPVTR